MEGVTVPIYSFHCKESKKSYTLTIPLAEYEKGKFACPKCKSRKVEQRVAAFFAVSAKKS